MTPSSGTPVVGLVADLGRSGPHPRFATQEKYVEAVAAGSDALVVLLPGRTGGIASRGVDEDVGRLLDRLDAVFLTGATSNVAPAAYALEAARGEPPYDPARDAVSLPLIRAAVARDLPVFGVCRGIQELNVALGGTLHPRVHAVDGFADHREREAASLDVQYGPAHEVTFVPGGLLASLAGARGARVNSLHGQGIDRLAPGLVVEARAPDGLVEAVSLPGRRFVLGVQWHPEWRFRDDPLSVALFAAFGQAARATARGEAVARGEQAA